MPFPLRPRTQLVISFRVSLFISWERHYIAQLHTFSTKFNKKTPKFVWIKLFETNLNGLCNRIWVARPISCRILELYQYNILVSFTVLYVSLLCLAVVLPTSGFVHGLVVASDIPIWGRLILKFDSVILLECVWWHKLDEKNEATKASSCFVVLLLLLNCQSLVIASQSSIAPPSHQLKFITKTRQQIVQYFPVFRSVAYCNWASVNVNIHKYILDLFYLCYRILWCKLLFERLKFSVRFWGSFFFLLYILTGAEVLTMKKSLFAKVFKF